MQLARWAIFGSFVGIFMRMVTPGQHIDTLTSVMMVSLFLVVGMIDQMRGNTIKNNPIIQ